MPSGLPRNERCQPADRFERGNTRPRQHFHCPAKRHTSAPARRAGPKTPGHAVPGTAVLPSAAQACVHPAVPVTWIRLADGNAALRRRDGCTAASSSCRSVAGGTGAGSSRVARRRQPYLGRGRSEHPDTGRVAVSHRPSPRCRTARHRPQPALISPSPPTTPCLRHGLPGMSGFRVPVLVFAVIRRIMDAGGSVLRREAGCLGSGVAYAQQSIRYRLRLPSGGAIRRCVTR